MPTTPKLTRTENLAYALRGASFSPNSERLKHARTALDQLAVGVTGRDFTGVIGVEVSVHRGQFGKVRRICRTVGSCGEIEEIQMEPE